MKLYQVPNLRVEDFPSEQGWIGRLFIQLNPLIQTLNQILNLNIDYATNIKAISTTYTITSFQSFSFMWPYAGFAPVDCRVISAFKGTDLTPTILLLAWSYDPTTSLITVSRMVEVNSSSISELSGRYQFTVRAQV